MNTLRLATAQAYWRLHWLVKGTPEGLRPRGAAGRAFVATYADRGVPATIADACFRELADRALCSSLTEVGTSTKLADILYTHLNPYAIYDAVESIIEEQLDLELDDVKEPDPQPMLVTVDDLVLAIAAGTGHLGLT